MLRQLETALLLVLAATWAGGATRARSITGTCAQKDARSDRLIANLKAFVGKSDVGGTIEKTTMGVKDLTPAQVALVTNNSICSKAAAALEKKLLEKRSSYSLYVVTIGSSYAVEDTKMLQPGFETADIFDKDWKYIGVRQIHS